jgi:hypothetical protein
MARSVLHEQTRRIRAYPRRTAMRASNHPFLSAALACCALVACNGDDVPGAEPPGRGSAACRDLQDALCDFAADRCGVTDRTSCDDMFRGIECTSDEVASTCANTLNGAMCVSGAGGCDLAAVIDEAPAIARCEALVSAVCERTVACGIDATDCALDMTQGLSCDQAVSIDLRYEECLEAIDMLACEGFAVPQVCASVVRVLPASMGGAS